MLEVSPPPPVIVVNASPGRLLPAVGRQGSSSKPAFHDGGAWSAYRMQTVLTEAWSRGCAIKQSLDDHD